MKVKGSGSVSAGIPTDFAIGSGAEVLGGPQIGSCGSGFHPSALDWPDPAGFGRAKPAPPAAAAGRLAQIALGWRRAPVDDELKSRRRGFVLPRCLAA